MFANRPYRKYAAYFPEIEGFLDEVFGESVEECWKIIINKAKVVYPDKSSEEIKMIFEDHGVQILPVELTIKKVEEKSSKKNKVKWKPPVNKEHYNPIEIPPRYPLELTKDLHICMWTPDGRSKYTIAYVAMEDDCPSLFSVGDRILDDNIDLENFWEIVEQAFNIARKNIPGDFS